jgi:Rrf2 family protein
MARPTSTQFAVAVHVLTYLAGALPRARAVSSEELALSANANPVHVRRVLGPLREAGLVVSRPGPRGGWGLGRPAADITVAQVWDLVQGHEPVLGLHGPNPDCPVGRSIQRALTELDAHARQAVRAELDRVTVADLAAGVTV